MISSRMSVVKSAAFMMLACVCAFAAEGDAAAAETAVKTAVNPAIFYAIAVIMSVGSIAASMAVGKVGAAAMGAAAEKPELLGKAIAFVGLGEGIALFGFLISLFLVNKI